MDRLTIAHPLEGMARLILREGVVSVVEHSLLLELRGRPAVLAQHFPGLLPVQPNRSVAHDTWRAAWLRPNTWLVSGSEEVRGQRWAEVLRAQEGGLCRLTDVAHARVCLRLPRVAGSLVLAKGTPLDLRPSRFGPGQCAQTWCAGFAVLLDCGTAGIDVYVDVSLAVAFWNWLSDAALGV